MFIERRAPVTCAKCGSSKVREFSAEMAFSGGTKFPPVYALAKPVLCVDCGFLECFVAEDPLNQLRENIAAQPKTIFERKLRSEVGEQI